MKKTNHEGLHTHRLRDNPAEERLAEQWRKEQEGRLLQYLMTPPGEDQRFTFWTTERDELVAATVIQWLGSPVGQGFLRSCGFVEDMRTNPEADELARLRKLFQDAGSPECDVLRLVEFCQSEMLRLKAEIKRLRDADASLRAAEKRRDERENHVRKILGAKGMESTEAAAERIRDNTRDLLDVMRGRFEGEAEYNAIMSVAEAFAGKAGE